MRRCLMLDVVTFVVGCSVLNPVLADEGGKSNGSECNFDVEPIAECSGQLRSTLISEGGDLWIVIPVCMKYAQDSEPADKERQPEHPFNLVVGDNGQRVRVGSVRDTVVIGGEVVHRGDPDGDIQTITKCGVYPLKSSAFAQNTADTKMRATTEQSPALPSWIKGAYGFFGLGAYGLHTNLTCPAADGGCNGTEPINFISGKHAQFDLGLGVRFSRYVAFEMSAALMPGVADTATKTGAGLESGTSMQYAADIQPARLRVDIPFTSRLSVYSTAGVGFKSGGFSVDEHVNSALGGCAAYDSVTGQCIHTAYGDLPIVADKRSRMYLPVSVGLEWWFRPDWAFNLNYQPPRGPDTTFYRMTLNIVGAFSAQ